MTKLKDIDVSRNCGWEFPDWNIANQAEWFLWYVEFKTPDICKGCDFVMQCTQRLSASLLWMPQLTPDSLEHEKLMAKMQKAMMMMMMMIEWDLTQEAYFCIVSEVQSKVWELDNGSTPYIN